VADVFISKENLNGISIANLTSIKISQFSTKAFISKLNVYTDLNVPNCKIIFTMIKISKSKNWAAVPLFLPDRSVFNDLFIFGELFESKTRGISHFWFRQF